MIGKQMRAAILGAGTLLVFPCAAHSQDMEKNFGPPHKERCHKVKYDIEEPSLRRGDIVKVLHSRLGRFLVSRAIADIGELDRYCKLNQKIPAIGWLDGEMLERWPRILLRQRPEDIFEKCFVVDGPANVRDEPKGRITHSIKDYRVVKVIRRDGDWFLISAPIEPVGDDYYYPLECMTSSELRPMGWTHMNNLKYFPTPLIKQTVQGVEILRTNQPIIGGLSMHALGMGVLQIGIFSPKTPKSEYIGALVIQGDYMRESKAFFFSESKLINVPYRGEWVRATEKGIEATHRETPSDSLVCDFVTTLYAPDGSVKVINRRPPGDSSACGAG